MRNRFLNILTGSLTVALANLRFSLFTGFRNLLSIQLQQALFLRICKLLWINDNVMRTLINHWRFQNTCRWPLWPWSCAVFAIGFAWINGLQQHSDVPTHKSGHTLDLIITRRAECLLSTDPMADYLFSDHFPVISDLITDQETIGHC